jgi:hypothetical protein
MLEGAELATGSRLLEDVQVKTKVSIRYLSGRNEEFEVELWGGKWAEARLKEFANNPTFLFQTDEEVIIIPATAIETISIHLMDSEGESIALPDVRKARRVT